MKTMKKFLPGWLLAAALVWTVAFAARPVQAAGGYADGTYSIAVGGKYSSGMIKSDETDGPTTVVVKGNEAWLVTRAYAPNRYDAVWKGKRSEAPEDAATASGLIMGTPIADEDGSYAASGANNDGIYTIDGVSCKAMEFVIPLTEEELSAGSVYFVLRYASWYTKNALKWMGSNDQHFDFGTLTKKSDSTELPSYESASSEITNLSIYDEELMFKVVNAYLEKKDGKTEFVFCLSAKGYEDIFPGTFDEAIANGKNKSAWIHYSPATVDCVYETKSGVQNDGTAEKYQFRVPVTVSSTGKTRIPIVAISKSRMTSAESANPDNPDYSAAFTARLALIDMDAKSVRTGNYQDTVSVKVTSSINTFQVEQSGTLYIVGTPAANEYTCQATITMKDDTYDKAFLGSAADAAAASDLIAIGSDKTFVLPFKNSLGKTSMIKDGKATAAFHVKDTDQWIERTFAMDAEAKTVAVSGEEIQDGKTVLAVTNNQKMFKVMDGAYLEERDGKNVLVAALSGTGYEYLFKGTYAEAKANGTKKENWIKYAENSEGKYEFVVPLKDGETKIPVVAISKKNLAAFEEGTGSLEQALTPRSFVIDYTAKTLTTDNDADGKAQQDADLAKIEEKAAADQKAADEAMALVEAANGTFKTAAEAQAAVDAAKAAVKALTEDQKKLLPADADKKLEEAQKKADALKAEEDKKKAEEKAAADKKAADEAMALIEAANGTFETGAEAQAAVDAAKAALEALTEDQKKLLPADAEKKLEEAQKKADALKTDEEKKQEEEQKKQEEEQKQKEDKKIVKAAKVKNLKAVVKPAKKTITFTFDPVENIDFYQLSYKKAAAKSWTKLKIKKNKTTVKNIKTNSLIIVRVRAGKTIGGKDCYGSYSKAVRVFQNQAAIKKLKAGKEQLTVAWKKQSGISGVQVEISLAKTFDKSRVITITGKKKTNTVIKKLKTGKTYYVRMRTYKVSQSKRYLGAWSTIKKAKIQ